MRVGEEEGGVGEDGDREVEEGVEEELQGGGEVEEAGGEGVARWHGGRHGAGWWMYMCM